MSIHSLTNIHNKKYNLYLFAAFTVLWLWGAVNPTSREDWFLENILVFLFVPLVIGLGKHFKISSFSYTLISVYMMLHVIGAHFSYGQVPIGYTIQHIIGAPRNMYDRFMHFSFGLMIAFPVREAFMKVARVKGFWSFFFPIELVFASSALYEIMEWLVAKVVSPKAAFAFLGSQGDIWDTQKDMLVAGIGAIVCMLIVYFVERHYNKNLSHEIRESLRPLKNGESEQTAAVNDTLPS